MVDASFAVNAILPGPRQRLVVERFADWYRQGQRLLTPALWQAEVVSAMRLQVYAGRLTVDEGRRALVDLFDLGLEVVVLSPALCLRAFDWAAQLGQARAYDAFYLALAEQETAQLWTADQRLAERAAQLKLDWVCWLPVQNAASP